MQTLIDLEVNEHQLKRTAEVAKARGIRIPTLDQMKNPDSIPVSVKERLRTTGLWDVDPGATASRVSATSTCRGSIT